MARRKSSRGRVFYYPSSLPKMKDGDGIINEDTEKERIRVDVANESTTWSKKFTDIINNPSNYSQAEVIDAVSKLAALYPDSDKIITTPGVSPSEAGTRYVEKDPATGLPKLKKGGNIQKQGYKDNSPYRNRRYIDIYSNNITMDGVSQPLRVKTDTGEERILEPNSGEYYFPGANVVREMPLRDTPLYFSPSSRRLAKYQTGGFLPMYEEGGDVLEEDVTEENVSDATIDEYIETLMQQENAAMKGYDADKGLWFPHEAPEEGGGMDIGYGHKIKSDEDFSEGLTDAQVRSLLASDLTEKMDSAARKFNNKSYDRTWDDLSTEEQILLTDYEYNVGLTKFPKLMKAVAEQDIETMLSQYKRYSDGKPLTSRNNWTKGFIEDKIKRVSANLEEETIETLKTTPIDNRVAPNVILNTFPQGQTQNLETKSSEAIPNPVQSTYSLEKVTQAPYPIRKEQLGTLDERQYTLDNIVSPVVGNPYKGKDNYSRTRGPGEKGSGLYDTEGKKYSLVDYYDKKTGEKVGTYNPMTNQVIDEYQTGGQLPEKADSEVYRLYLSGKHLKQGYPWAAQQGTGRAYPDAREVSPEFEYEGDKHWNVKRFAYAPFFGRTENDGYHYNNIGIYTDKNYQGPTTVPLEVGKNKKEQRKLLTEDMTKYYLGSGYSEEEASNKAKTFVKDEVMPLVNSKYHKMSKNHPIKRVDQFDAPFIYSEMLITPGEKRMGNYFYDKETLKRLNEGYFKSGRKIKRLDKDFNITFRGKSKEEAKAEAKTNYKNFKDRKYTISDFKKDKKERSSQNLLSDRGESSFQEYQSGGQLPKAQEGKKIPPDITGKTVGAPYVERYWDYSSNPNNEPVLRAKVDETYIHNPKKGGTRWVTKEEGNTPFQQYLIDFEHLGAMPSDTLIKNDPRRFEVGEWVDSKGNKHLPTDYEKNPNEWGQTRMRDMVDGYLSEAFNKTYGHLDSKNPAYKNEPFYNMDPLDDKYLDLYLKFQGNPTQLQPNYVITPEEEKELRYKSKALKNGGSLPKAEVMTDPATGLPKLKKGGKAWIQRTIKKRKKIK